VVKKAKKLVNVVCERPLMQIGRCIYDKVSSLLIFYYLCTGTKIFFISK
jgi:hypothetical protein